ncbi:hypothetical protein AAHC03_016608 [Spirometra sp. Aus1]
MRDAIPEDEETFFFAKLFEGNENTSETGTVRFSQAELQRKYQLTKLLMDRGSERDDSHPKSATEIDIPARAEADYKELKKLHVQALAAFEFTMQHSKKRRAELQARIEEFEERKRNFQQFIVDNLQKIKRQHKHFTESRYAQIVARNAMAEILKHTKALRASEDPITSLMLRFQTLTSVQSNLILQFQDKEIENELRIQEAREKRERDQREIMQKTGEIQRLCSTVELWRERVQEEINNKERLQDKISAELEQFFTCIRGLRNIARKAEKLLKSLHYKDVISSDVEEASLTECLHLLHVRI